ncbi:MAG: hypothetical protein H6942_10540 [Candidatus Accumulibacter sp.]|nr:hypothetical protein [Accumulibacter sp.]MCB1942978.1 hypothetical protein [Accumulibacter sp.]MCP5248951.1 hypothetical protein [Accumulibacter sp.]
MLTDGRPDSRPNATATSPRTPDRRRSAGDRRAGIDRRRSGDRRRAHDGDALIAELERRVAAAIRQNGGNIGNDGSGWDKLIIPFD